MKSLGNILFAVLLFAFSGTMSHARQIPKDIDSRFNLAILEALDNYEMVSSFFEPDDSKKYQSLFLTPDKAVVYNDLMFTTSYQQMVTPRDYAKMIPADGSIFIKTAIHDVQKAGEAYMENNEIHKKIIFSKYMMVIDASCYNQGPNGGVFFDSSTMYEGEPDFNLIADFQFDPKTGRCKIASLASVSLKPASPLDENQFDIIVKPESKYKDYLVSGGKAITYDEYGQGITEHDSLKTDSRNLVVKTQTLASNGRYDVKSVDMRALKFRCKLSGSFLPVSAYSVKSTYSGMNLKSKGFNFGVDVGVETSPLNRLRLGLYTGIGLSFNSIDMSVDSVKYKNPFGREKNRDYNFSASEGISMMDVVIPCYFDLEYDLNDRMMISASLGCKFYVNNKTDLKPYNVIWKYEDVQISKTYTQFISPTRYSQEPLDISIFGNVEYDIRLLDQYLYAFCLVGYESGVKSSFTNGGHIYFDEPKNVYPFVYSDMHKDDIPLRSLIGSLDYRRSALNLALGFKIKF